MAGIGFALRQLAQNDNLSSGLRSYAHAAAVSAGPWLFTVISLGAVELFGRNLLERAALTRFSIIVIYNFSFSLVLSGPIVLIMTRHLADRLYAEEAKQAPGMLVGGLSLLWAVQAIIGIPFFIFVTDLSSAECVVAMAGFFFVGGIWLASVFLSALKSFETITFAFASGMAAAFVLAALFTEPFGVTGTLAGFTTGLAMIFYILLARILAEYPYEVVNPFGFLIAFRQYRELACVGLFYNAGIWVDKWIMWLSPGGRIVAGGLASHPAYDGAMFLAYLSIVPALTLFLVSIETRFFGEYLRFYREIQGPATLQEIRRNHQSLRRTLVEGFRNISVVQAVVCYLAILVAPGLIGIAKGGLELVPIFRFGVLGAFFHSLLLFVMVIISYFDLRRLLLVVTVVFFLCNAAFTLLMMPLGPAYTGYGYFLACLVSLTYAYSATAWRIKRLLYMTFVANNPGLH